MLDGAEGEEKAQGFANFKLEWVVILVSRWFKPVIRFQTFVGDDGFPKIVQTLAWFPNWGMAAQPLPNQDWAATKLHLTFHCGESWCSSLLGGLVESWAHWAQGSEDERSQHCASFAGHGGDLQVASECQ